MLSKGFKIYDKKRFDLYIENIVCGENEAIVKIDKACICKADLRYYLGYRDKRILALKYPMNLLHEAIGIVTMDNSNSFSIGQKVVLVPNIKPQNCNGCRKKICEIENLGDNYCCYSQFVSSNCDGFSREYVSYNVNNLIAIPKDIGDTAVFLELISVVNSAIRRIKINKNDVIGIWGDGILGYILFTVLKHFYKNKIVVIGKHKEKLNNFYDCKTIIENNSFICKDIDIAFECVGGDGMEYAINQILENISHGGQVILTGVQNVNVQMNTRLILEKGISILGATRSKYSDFSRGLEMLQNEKFRKDIEILKIEKRKINNIADFYDAFEDESRNKNLGKIILDINI